MRTRYRFLTDCVNAPSGEAITDMVDRERPIAYRTFRRWVRADELAAVLPYYERDRRRGLTLAADFAVSFHRSRYLGQPCVYVLHSAIEHIFGPDTGARRVRPGSNYVARC